jgi:hypothetical protein
MAEYYCYGEELFIKCILDKLEANGLLEYCSIVVSVKILNQKKNLLSQVN